MTVHWYLYNLQPHRVVFLVATATKILHFAPKYGLPGDNMAGFGKKSGFGYPAFPVFRYLSDELIFTLYWYPYNLQPILSFAPKYGCGDLNNGPNHNRSIVRAPQGVYAGPPVGLVAVWGKYAPLYCYQIR